MLQRKSKKIKNKIKQNKIKKKKKKPKMLIRGGGSFVQIFFSLFASIFSPIWRDCILKGEQRKIVGPTTFLSSSLFQPNNEKCHFPLYFPLLIFQIPYFYPNQTYP